jgi:hypothetical protein
LEELVLNSSRNFGDIGVERILEFIREKCPEIDCTELIQYILDTLPKDQMETISDHVKGCPYCWWKLPKYKRPKLPPVERSLKLVEEAS